MMRRDIEEAVENTKHFLTMIRGAKGLVELAEVALNHTKLVDGLEERKLKLEADILKLQTEHQEHENKTRISNETIAETHKQRIEQLKQEEVKYKERVDKLNYEFGRKRDELEKKHHEAELEHDAWMEDCRQKQIAANETLTLVTKQIDDIKNRLR